MVLSSCLLVVLGDCATNVVCELCSFFFQAEDGIRDLVRSRGLGDVYKRQPYPWTREHAAIDIVGYDGVSDNGQEIYNFCKLEGLSLIHI